MSCAISQKKPLQVSYPASTIFPVLVVVDVLTSGIQPTNKLLYYPPAFLEVFVL